MNAVIFRKTVLAPGLYLVATPIGTARDITLRALDVLASVDMIAAEDTRTLRRLMQIHDIPLEGRPLTAYHDHSSERRTERLVGEIARGRSVAYASEAGTPLISDPGFGLCRATIAADLPVTPVPGPSAITAALTVAGLPADRFLFAGFPPRARAARRRFLQDLAGIGVTLILYESPRRIRATLADCKECFGGDRHAALSRELTKRFEETVRGTLAGLADTFANRDPKGEIVLLIEGAEAPQADWSDVENALREAMKDLGVRDAAKEVSARLSLPRRQVYQAALALVRGK